MSDSYEKSYRRRPVNSFWLENIDGELYLYIDPKIDTDTSEKLSGSCTISGSVITDATGPFGSDNSLIDYPVDIGDTIYRVIASTSTTLTVQGTPSDSETSYTLYEKGLEIHYTGLLSDLSSDSDELDVSLQDASLICMIVAKRFLISHYKGNPELVNFAGLNSMIEDTEKAIIERKRLNESTRKYIEPMKLRSDHAGRTNG